jgi:hypothetical protein
LEDLNLSVGVHAGALLFRGYHEREVRSANLLASERF